jgi:transcriptional regulator with XRE-family HTH domain
VLSDTLKQELARYTIGEKVRALRWQRNMRLVDVAQRTGLSPALLSKIERGNSVPSLSVLCLIAAAFDVKLADFFPQSRHRAPAITRRGERIRLPEAADLTDPAYDFECLNFTATEPSLCCYRAEFKAAAKPRFHAHEGLEFIYLASGQLRVSLMSEDLELGAGDSMYFDSGVPHCYRKVGPESCVGLIVTCPAVSGARSVETYGPADTRRLRTREILWRQAS